MVFTHKVIVHFPTSLAPGLDQAGSQLEVWEIVQEMAGRNLTGGLQSGTRVHDGESGTIFTRSFVSEAAAQEFSDRVHQFYPTLEHVCTVVEV
jgi:hypothetical protein